MGAMEQSGEYRIAAPRDRVWAALNDPDVLRRCLEGCESLSRGPEGSFHAVVKAKIGPLSAAFEGEVALKDLDPPNGYTMEVTAKGGAAGFARGTAKVALAADGAETRLTYAAEGRVGGKLAQIGQRLIDAAARKTADDFFAAFQREVEGPAEPPAPTDGTAPAIAGAPLKPLLTWTAVALGLAVAAVVAWRLLAH